MRSWNFVDRENCILSGSDVVRLTPKAAAVLRCLLKNKGQTVSRDQLLAEVWNGVCVTPDLVREYIFDLRVALGDSAENPMYIETVRGKGFRLCGKVSFSEEESRLLCNQGVPSIAVLPFVNLGDNPKIEVFSDGIALDVITDLSKFSNLFVMAANSTFQYKGKAISPHIVGTDLGVRYMLEGSVQGGQSQLRINAQLIDTVGGQHLWAQRWDRDFGDFLKIQNEIAREIVAVIGPISNGSGKLLASELKLLDHESTGSFDAYAYFLKADLVFRREDTPDSLERAREGFDKAIALDPTYAKAFARKAWTFAGEYWYGGAEDPNEALMQAEELALRAVDIDPAEGEALKTLGAVHLFRHRHDLAIHSVEKALSMNPNNADMMMWFGWILVYCDQVDEGFSWMRKALDRNPYAPDWYFWDLAWAHFNAFRYEEAVDALNKEYSKGNLSYLLLSAASVRAGDTKTAFNSIQKFRQAAPNYTLDTVARLNPFRSTKALRHYEDALKEAGLPTEHG